MTQVPIKLNENLQLVKLGVDQSSIGFSSLTLESEKYVCVCDRKSDPAQVVIFDVANPGSAYKYPIKADSARMNPTCMEIALKAEKSIQVFDSEKKKKVNDCFMASEITYWRWISSTTIAIVTDQAVFHWKVEDKSPPIKVFDRRDVVPSSQVISYKTDSACQWMALVSVWSKDNRINGSIQLHSVQRNASQTFVGHACEFAMVTMEGNNTPSNVFTFATRTPEASRLNITEVGEVPAGNQPFSKRSVEMPYPADAASDFPFSIHSDRLGGVVYIITKMGYMHMYELETGNCIFVNRISQEVIFVSAPFLNGEGFIFVNRAGFVLSASINKDAIVPYLCSRQMEPLAYKLAERAGYPGAENVFIAKFNELFARGMYSQAAKIAAKSTGTSIRNAQTIARFQELTPSSPGQHAPILIYFSTLLESGKLNALESIELCRPVITQGKKNLIEKWLVEEKLECTEELGDLAKTLDNNLANSIYLRANCHHKVIQCFAETGQFQKILLYCKKVNYQADFPKLLRAILYTNKDAGLQFALDLVREKVDGLDLNALANCFVEQRFIIECSAFLVEALKEDRADQADLQTKLFELTLMSNPQLAEAIFAKNIITHYDKARVAVLCEQAGLIQRALQFYTDIYDIKRAIIQTNLLNQEFLVSYFGTLSVDDSLTCLAALLETNRRQNLPIVVQVSVKYHEQLGSAALIRLFEATKSSEGLFMFLSAIINFSQDPDVHFKYIQAACKTNQLKEVERICKESNFYDPEKVKNFLKEIKQMDPTSLIIVCDRFNFIPDLILHLNRNNLLKYLEVYVQKANTSRLPDFVGALLDVDCSEEFIVNMMMGCPPTYSMEGLVEQVSKRNRMKLLRPVIESRVAAGSNETGVHTALAIVCIENNNRPEAFLRENAYYDTLAVGRYCETRDSNLACLAYEKGGNDDELIRVCVRDTLYKILCRYVVTKKDKNLWAKILNPANDYRRSFIDQLSQSVLSESYEPECVSEMVKAFMSADLPSVLIDLLEKLVLSDSQYRSIRNLQNLLLLTSIKSDPSRTLDYINRLDNYDAPNIANVAISHNLYEEAFTIYKKFDVHPSAVEVLTDLIKNLDRAFEYCERCNAPLAWSKLGRAQLANDQPKEAIDSFLKAEDFTQYAQVISISRKFSIHESLVKYLALVRTTVRDSLVDSEYAYSLAFTGRYEQLNDLLAQTHNVNLVETGDRLFDCEKYEAAKIIYKNASNYSKLAATHVKLGEFQFAVEMARKANNTKVWRAVCLTCLGVNEIKFAHICALNLVVHPEELDELVRNYEDLGLYTDLLYLLESAVNLERAHMGIFTDLAILYAKYKPQKLKDHIELYWSRINIPKVIRAAETFHLWSELVFLHDKYEEYDNAISIMIRHPAAAFVEPQFRDIIQKVANHEILYKSITFYYEYKPLMLNDLMIVLSSRIDHSKAVERLRSLGVIAFCKGYLLHVQRLNIPVINEALNDLYIEEGAHDDLRQSIEAFNNFDANKLADKLETHEFVEFRRISTLIRKISNRWGQTIDMAIKDGLFDDAIVYAAESRDPLLAESLLNHFITNNRPDYLISLLYFCYDIIQPDQVLEACWLGGMTQYCFPYLIQFVKEYYSKINLLEGRVKSESPSPATEHAQINLFNPQLMITGSQAYMPQGVPQMNNLSSQKPPGLGNAPSFGHNPFR